MVTNDTECPVPHLLAVTDDICVTPQIVPLDTWRYEEAKEVCKHLSFIDGQELVEM